MINQTPKIGRDDDIGINKGFAFINFESFEAADAAIEAMNGQYLCNKSITVTYALKKDGKGEKHGSAAERLLAAKAKKNQPSALVPNFNHAPAAMTQISAEQMAQMGFYTPMQQPPPPSPLV